MGNGLESADILDYLFILGVLVVMAIVPGGAFVWGDPDQDQ